MRLEYFLPSIDWEHFLNLFSWEHFLQSLLAKSSLLEHFLRFFIEGLFLYVSKFLQKQSPLYLLSLFWLVKGYVPHMLRFLCIFGLSSVMQFSTFFARALQYFSNWDLPYLFVLFSCSVLILSLDCG